MSRVAVVLVCIFFVATFSGVTARLPRVGILHAEETNLPTLENLLQEAFPGGVGIWDGAFIVPPLTWLQQYDAIVMFSDYRWGNQTATCANVATYLDQGGRVVTGLFATFTDLEDDKCVCDTGEFNATYTVIVPQIGEYYTEESDTLGPVFYPNHPIMQGITNFSMASWHPIAPQQYAAGTYVVAEWSNGGTLVAVRDDVGPYSHSRVDLGFWFAPGEDVDFDNCNFTNGTEGACPMMFQLMVNSLTYTLRDYTSSPASTLSFFWTPLLSYFFHHF